MTATLLGTYAGSIAQNATTTDARGPSAMFAARTRGY
jgi:hypothetical protein